MNGSSWNGTKWLICIIASIGFLFDTYELLMTPLVGVPAIAELLKLPPNHPEVTGWMGRMLWMTALCGGTFGLLGGWFIDRFGRKRMMAVSIFIYALSPFAAAFASTLPLFIFFRCTTFIGVCIEFVAAITWLAELFPDKRQREIVLGTTQAFASVGGLLVTAISAWISQNAATLPSLPVSEVFNQHASWRYLLITGLLPAIPIALMLPFVPESEIWRKKRAEGTLQRPSFGSLFSPELKRVTLVTAALSACAYAGAFGALQLTPRSIVPGLQELSETRSLIRPLQKEAGELNRQLDTVMPEFRRILAEIPDLDRVTAQRAKVRVAQRAARKADDKAALANLGKQFAGLDAELEKVTASKPEAKKVVLEREKILKGLGDNREKQEPLAAQISSRGEKVQMTQEFGGLAGRILLALLVLVAMTRRTLLRLFVVPGLLFFPLTYFYLFNQSTGAFMVGMFLCGWLVVGQFSYFGEYLPKVFPIHLRGTGGSFATNVGGRMIGTSAAFLTTNWIAPLLNKTPAAADYAMAAGITAAAAFLLSFFLTFLLPEPKPE